MTTQETETSQQFTIYDNYRLFSPYLYSVWQVERTGTYIATRTRVGEPFQLYCFIRTFLGKGIVRTESGTFILPPNSLILLDVRSIIKYSPTKEKWTYLWYNFTTENATPFFQPNKIYLIDKTYPESALNEEMFSLMENYDETNVMLTTALFVELVYRWIKYCKDEINNTIPHYANIKKVLAYINNNINLDLSITRLAKSCFLSERHFREVFKQFTGLSPKQYICQQKLKRIAVLLKTTSSTVNMLASEFNYSSPFQLSRDFKKYYGVSPKAYREKS